ncbi:MAG TPA: MotA/TolQ/ExbB proton channel family protein [Syntrophorhabdales bacterium]|nr:MotA/TolQ/ExbB proton channel family protein [Syntrophorhabdales bacterium]
MGLSDFNAYTGGLLALLYSAGAVAKTVVFILFCFSLVSWAVIFLKWKQFSRIDRDGDRFLKIIKESDSFKRLANAYRENPESPFYRLLIATYKETAVRQKESLEMRPEIVPAVENVLRITTTEEMERLESRLSFLATTANAAPFIGLFGTVWGIMDSFREIGLRGSTSLVVVAPGISEALITTALGLATAIPAVLGYNYLLARLKGISSKLENASGHILNLITR